MPSPGMATSVDLATTISKTAPSVTTVVNTPPPVTTTAHPDFTVKNTGRATTATQSSLTKNNRGNH